MEKILVELEGTLIGEVIEEHIPTVAMEGIRLWKIKYYGNNELGYVFHSMNFKSLTLLIFYFNKCKFYGEL